MDKTELTSDYHPLCPPFLLTLLLTVHLSFPLSSSPRFICCIKKDCVALRNNSSCIMNWQGNIYTAWVDCGCGSICRVVKSREKWSASQYAAALIINGVFGYRTCHMYNEIHVDQDTIRLLKFRLFHWFWMPLVAMNQHHYHNVNVKHNNLMRL